MPAYQPKTGRRCHCRPGVWRDNCPDCEGTGMEIDFAAIRARRLRREYNAANDGKPERDGHGNPIGASR